jgi:hypothetical protein
MPNPVLDQERAAFILGRQEGAPKVTLPAWPRHDKELPLIEVDVNWVRFSTLNHRTKAEQLRAIHQSQKPELFTSDPMGQAAQDAQYKILKGQDGFDDLKADLMDRGQQDPAVITAEGVLINGNRRSAALRGLYQDDDYLKARYVKCLVLPADASAGELVDLETELQIARDFKEDYSWVNEAMLIEELYDREGKNFGRVAKRMHREAGPVQSRYERLQQLNQLIALSNGAYLHIDFADKESAFDELAKHIKNKPKREADSVRAAYYLGTLADVNYRDLRSLRRPDAAALVRRELDADPILKPLLRSIDHAATVEKVSGDPLDDLLGPQDEGSEITAVLSYLAQRRRDEMISVGEQPKVAVSDVFGTIKSAVTLAAREALEEQRDQTAVEAPLQRLSNAIDEIGRAAAALRRARSFKEWDEASFRTRVIAVGDALKALEADLDQG